MDKKELWFGQSQKNDKISDKPMESVSKYYSKNNTTVLCLL